MRTVTGSAGVYEARYGLTWRAVRLLALCVALLSVALLPVPFPVVVLDVAFFGFCLVVLLATSLSRRIAFRADVAGVTLGGALPRYRASTAFIPWADIAGMHLFELQLGRPSTPYIRVVRHDGAPELPGALGFDRWNRSFMGTEFAACRQITAWTLDLPRLRAVLAQVAPDVEVTGSLAGRPTGFPLRRLRMPRDPRFLVFWRFLAPLGLVSLAFLGVQHLVPAWSAHLGHGRTGTWTVVRNDCAKGDCLVRGRFVSADGADVRDDVRMGHGAPPIPAVGGSLPAVDTGDPGFVFPPGGGPAWWVYSLVTAGAAAFMALWARTVPVALIRRRLRRSDRDAAMIG
jgi:hypothetical protein